MVVAPRFRVRAEAFAPIGLRTTRHPTGLGEVVEVDATGQSAVPGLYAAGNVTDPGMQVLHSAAHGSRVATYLKGRVRGRVVSRAVVIATGVTATGDREVLGVDVGDSEDGAF